MFAHPQVKATLGVTGVVSERRGSDVLPPGEEEGVGEWLVYRGHDPPLTRGQYSDNDMEDME